MADEVRDLNDGRYRLPRTSNSSQNDPMLTIQRRAVLAAVTALLAFLGPLGLRSTPLVATEDIPAQLSDEAFWSMVTEFSETGGYFRSDNFVSNETTVQYFIKGLKKAKP